MIMFSKKHQGRNHSLKLSIILDDNKIEEKPEVKYLEVILDQFLSSQGEVENILGKMACGIKTLQLIKKTTDNKNLITLIERFSHKPSAPLSY